MNVPYNTGKVKIGSNYHPRKINYEKDPDMLLLQYALIGNTKADKRNRLFWVIYAVVLFSSVVGVYVLN